MHNKQIQEITAKGIKYLDDSGFEQFIEFADCFNNYYKKQTSPEYLKRFQELNNMSETKLDSWVINHFKTWREVGEWDISGNPPFIEFHTKPPTRFEFDDIDEIIKVQILIWKLGKGALFDLS